MTESNNISKVPSNDEIVDDLIKDFQDSSIENDMQTPVEFKDSDSEIPSEDTEIDKNPIKPDDFVDEELLKKTNSLLTDEEKLANKAESIVLKNEGNDDFRNGDYVQSIRSYTDALILCPLDYTEDRSIYYANRAASKAKLGRTESAIEDCNKAIELNSAYMKAYLRRAKLYEDSGKLDESLDDYKKILEFDCDNKDAIGATIRLPPMINERNEKMKTEMVGKLKELGNVFLKPFGLSTENFQLQQDPGSGGYSINFQQKNK